MVLLRPYRYALALTSQFYFCGIPFRLDTAPKCPLNCSYCFAMTRGGRRTSIGLLANPNIIHEKMDKVFNRIEFQNYDITGELLKLKVPVHFGGMSDPFANTIISKTSQELLRILAKYNYPTVIITKNTDELLKDETICILKEMKNVIIQVSIPSYNSNLAQLIEPNVPSPMNRLKVLSFLAKEGFHTIVRLQPLLPKYINEISGDLIPQLGEADVKHVVVEFLKLPVEKNISNIDDLFNRLDWNGSDYYRSKNAIRTGREWVLPPKIKWDMLQPLIGSIHQNNMTFGAGDYGLNHLSDTDCCCGIDVVDGFSGWFKPNIPYLIKTTKSSQIDIKILEKVTYPTKSIRMYMNSQCRGAYATTIKDFIKLKWNRPGTENAPDTFLGVYFRGDYDDNNNCVYEKSLS
jgi:DNA repair photolyase